MDLLTPLYFGRTKSYCEQVGTLDTEEAESVVREQAEIFTTSFLFVISQRVPFESSAAVESGGPSSDAR